MLETYVCFYLKNRTFFCGNICFEKKSTFVYKISAKRKNYDKVYQNLPSVAWQRDKEISIISQSKNMPILVFTHPLDKWDGLYSDWVEKIPGVKRIIISDNYTIKDRDCKKGGHKVYKYHKIATAACFQEYNSTIKEYIASRIK